MFFTWVPCHPVQGHNKPGAMPLARCFYQWCQNPWPGDLLCGCPPTTQSGTRGNRTLEPQLPPLLKLTCRYGLKGVFHPSLTLSYRCL